VGASQVDLRQRYQSANPLQEIRRAEGDGAVGLGRLQAVQQRARRRLRQAPLRERRPQGVAAAEAVQCSESGESEEAGAVGTKLGGSR
jgi:hypothetical protein